jgi:hypothetical protein
MADVLPLLFAHSVDYSLIASVDPRNVQNDNIATLLVNDAPRVARVPARTFQAQLSEPAIARRSISAHFESVGSGQWSPGRHAGETWNGMLGSGSARRTLRSSHLNSISGARARRHPCPMTHNVWKPLSPGSFRVRHRKNCSRRCEIEKRILFSHRSVITSVQPKMKQDPAREPLSAEPSCR